MNNIVIGGCIYNEANKFLTLWLDSLKKISNKILIIDDGSTDNSLEICSKYTSNIIKTNRLFKQDEHLIRQKWWNEAVKMCEQGDFIMVLDADEVITENTIIHLDEELNNCIKSGADAIYGKKYDMWDDIHYREEPEKRWMENLKPWVAAIRCKKDYPYYFRNMPIHCGYLPINGFETMLNTKVQCKHLSYSTLELRKNKVEWYKEYDPNNYTGIEKIRYDSILDTNPRLIEFKDNYEI